MVPKLRCSLLRDELVRHRDCRTLMGLHDNLGYIIRRGKRYVICYRTTFIVKLNPDVSNLLGEKLAYKIRRDSQWTWILA